MTLTGVTLLVACVDTVLGAILLVIVIRHMNGRLFTPLSEEAAMPRLLGKHHREHEEEEDWRELRGRFAGIQAHDDPDRPDVMPFPQPDVQRQTHTWRRESPGGYADGTES